VTIRGYLLLCLFTDTSAITTQGARNYSDPQPGIQHENSGKRAISRYGSLASFRRRCSGEKFKTRSDEGGERGKEGRRRRKKIWKYSEEIKAIDWFLI